MTIKNKDFTKKLLEWGKQNYRPMPWKGEKNPYFIWLSEIILQQTRVEQGTKYFLAFKKNYPSIFDLAKAKEADVLKLWEGLGYYSRARNLHFTAKYIVSELNGVFPTNYKDLLILKGIGTYTASAIASFAYDIPKAVIDGNVIRVLSRIFGIENTFQKAKEKAAFQSFADDLISKKEPAIYNQAIMDFGAQICTPKKYLCSKCIFSSNCFAFKNDLQDFLPLKKKKIKIKSRKFSFFVFNFQNTTYIQQRTQKDIWKGLHQFPMVEYEENLTEKKKIALILLEKYVLKKEMYSIQKISKVYNQKLTHQKLEVNFIEISLKNIIKQEFINTDVKFLSKFAFPKIINVYLSDKMNNNGK